MGASACPTDELLATFADGRLDAAAAAVVARHLEGCVVCKAVAAALGRAAGSARTGPAPAPSVAPAAGVTFAVGDRIGRYQLRGILGSGGMGRVYDAYDEALDRPLALKVIRPELVRRAPRLTNRLLRESQLMAKVVHPAVIAVHDVGQVGDVVYVAMERIDGETLGRYVDRARPRWREIVALYRRAGEGLAAAHAVGVVHRDFKPDNVLVELAAGRVRRVVVTDFGVARLLDPPVSSDGATPVATDADADTRASTTATVTALTRLGQAVGTPAYMAPEQLAAKEVDARADVYAFAVSLWEALCGSRPFPGRTLAELRAAARDVPRLPRAAGPASLGRVLARGLAPTPSERWPELRSMLRALDGVLGQRRRRAWWGGGVAATIAAAVAVLTLGHGAAPDRCAVEASGFEAGFAARRGAFAAALGADRDAPEVLRLVERLRDQWRATQRATCGRPATPPVVAPCLAARRVEIEGTVDELIRSGPADAATLVDLISSPTKCDAAHPGLTTALVPEAPAVRAQVTALRRRLYAVEAARDAAQGDAAFAAAVAEAKAMTAATARTWPIVHAEALYIQGTTEQLAGDLSAAGRSLREAATVGAAAGHDSIAAEAGVKLVETLSLRGEPARALEAAEYAAAAAVRLGSPPGLTARLDAVRGTALAEAGRLDEAEGALREGLALAVARAPRYLPTLLAATASLDQQTGRLRAAVEIYRASLAKLPDQGSEAEAALRDQLATSLNAIGRTAEALVEIRRAVAITDRVMTAGSLERALVHLDLVSVLADVGAYAAALAELDQVTPEVLAAVGARSERYGEVLGARAEILWRAGRAAEARPFIAQACELFAFTLGEGEAAAACVLQRARIDVAGGAPAGAGERAATALAVLTAAYKDAPTRQARARMTYGEVLAGLGRRAEAAAALEAAIPILRASELDPGEWARGALVLARLLDDPARIRELDEVAQTVWAGRPGPPPELAAANRWLAAHPAR